LSDVFGDAFWQAYLPPFCRAVNLVIAPSQGLCEVLRRFGVDARIEVVPNGVDISPFRSAVEPVSRAELGFEPEDVVLVFTGRLGPEKNLSFLLRSFAGTAKTYERARLLLIGDGPERENLEAQARYMGIAGRVCFTGMVPYESLPRYLATADVFVTASVTEVHPLSIIEAMAAGLPTLGIQSPGVGDIVENEKTGILAPEEDLALFTAKMVRLVTETETRARLGAYAREASLAYSIERTSQLLLEHYQQMAHASAGRKRGIRPRFMQLIDRLLI
jgi:glycosyltransferase involved in cell wall biosynthesis